jgi:epsilon-lactone hydrolase
VRGREGPDRGLAERGISRIAVTGDSAGGNLALSLVSLVAAEAAAALHPVGVVVFSPITDLAMTGSSWQTRAEADPLLVREQAEGLIHAYLTGHDPKDPVASRIYGNFVGHPPIRVQVGEDEVLLDDALRFVERAVAVGIDATVDAWQGMSHGFVGTIAASRRQRVERHRRVSLLAARTTLNAQRWLPRLGTKRALMRSR